MMTGPRHNEGGRLPPLPDLVPDPRDHSFIVKMIEMIMMFKIKLIEMILNGNLRIHLKTHSPRPSLSQFYCQDDQDDD